MAKQPSVRSLRDAALHLSHFHGWSIVPVINKVPAVPWKLFQSRAPTDSELNSLFADKRVTGLSVVLGPVSNNVVNCDFDSESAFVEWQERQKKLADILPTIQTSRGRHVYFTGPTEFHITPYGEYRGDSGHYTLLPPSLHPSGKRYEWLIELCKPLPEIPDPVTVGLLPPKTPGITPPTTNNIHGMPPWKVANSHSLAIPANSQGWMLPPEVERIVKMHLPTGHGQRNVCIMQLVRYLKGTRVRDGWDRSKAWVAFRFWWDYAEDVVRDKSVYVSWKAFLRAWDFCHTPKQQLDVEELYRAAVMCSLPEQTAELPDSLKVLFGACTVLQAWNGGSEFFLSCIDAGRLLEHGQPWGSKALNFLRRNDWIELIEKGSSHSGKANVYRLANRFT